MTRCRYRSLRVTRLVAVAVATAWSSSAAQTIPGIRFRVDTAETNAPAAGVLSRFRGSIEFAAGRGRIDVSAVAELPARSVNGVTIGTPLARSGDYYLFDSTGYIVVRPSSRTFSVVSSTTSTYRHGNVREPWDGYFEFATVRPEDISPSDTVRLTQHGPFSVRWHLDRRNVGGPAEILARGRVLVMDAPRGEGSVARWIAVTPALATLPDSIKPLDSHLQLTAVVVLPPQSKGFGETNLIVLHPMVDIGLADIDIARLTLPPGYTERSWEKQAPALSSETTRHWQTMPPRTVRHPTPPNER